MKTCSHTTMRGFPGADTNRTDDPDATLCRGWPPIAAVAQCRFRPHHRDTSGRSGPRASAGSAGSPKRSISSPSRRRRQYPPALSRGGRTTGLSGRTEAIRAFGWFLGENDLQTPLIDPETGSCSDGLHPDRAMRTRVRNPRYPYLLGLVEIRQLKRMAAIDRTKPASKLVRGHVNGIIPPRTGAREPLVSIPIHKSPELISASGPGKGRRQAVQAGN